jgi:predicted pyridoxine 5'-phosphate oxidase superfamily flavin-nucleotide-binding protein
MDVGILTEEMQRLVRGQRLGFVATVSEDGRPNLSPKGTTDVWDPDHLIFADLASPRTVANLRTRPAVEVNVVDPGTRKGFRFRGTGRVYSEGALFDRAIDHFGRNGVTRPRDRVRSVVLIEVLEVEPVRSPGYDLGATEAETLQKWSTYYATLWSTGEAPGPPD